jgi:hypothetical protein
MIQSLPFGSSQTASNHLTTDNSSFTAATSLGATSQAYEFARLGFDTLLQLGVASCPTSPTLIDAIRNSADGGLATQLPSAGTIDDIRAFINRFKMASNDVVDENGQPINLEDAVKACLPGPKGLLQVAQLLNGVSTSYADRLPNGCPLELNSRLPDLRPLQVGWPH